MRPQHTVRGGNLSPLLSSRSDLLFFLLNHTFILYFLTLFLTFTLIYCYPFSSDQYFVSMKSSHILVKHMLHLIGIYRDFTFHSEGPLEGRIELIIRVRQNALMNKNSLSLSLTHPALSSCYSTRFKLQCYASLLHESLAYNPLPVHSLDSTTHS